MPAKKKVAPPKGPVKPANDGGLKIACADNCGATSMIDLDGAAPHKGATLADQGWAVLNSPEDHTISFLCPTCFNKLEIDESLEDAEAKDELDD